MSTPTAVLPAPVVHGPSHAKYWWIALGLLVASLVVVAGVMAKRHFSPSKPAPAFKFETQVLDRGPIEAKVTATGTVNPIVTVQVGAQVSGTIQKLGADFNTVVHPGQMMAQIDPRLFKASVLQAEANLVVAKASVIQNRAQAENAAKQAQRNHQLLARSLVAQQDVDTTDATLKVDDALLKAAVANVSQTEAALANARTNLAYTTIISPINGTVITRNIDVGQTVAAAFAAPTLFLVGEDLTKMQVDTSIAESDVGRLAAGMTATFTVDAYPGQVFSGSIREVRNSPQVIQNVVTYDAVVDVDNSKLLLKPGMTANIEVIYANRKDALRIANAGIRFRPPAELTGHNPPPVPQDRKMAWVLRSGTPSGVPFKPGVSDGVMTEVLEGELVAGDAIITEAVPAASTAHRIL